MSSTLSFVPECGCGGVGLGVTCYGHVESPVTGRDWSRSN
jgi:hypothetical protein